MSTETSSPIELTPRGNSVNGNQDDFRNGNVGHDQEAAVPAGVSSLRVSKLPTAVTTGLMAFQSLGAIYGDIGTSPLYVYSSIFPSTVPTESQTLGAASCIFWAFTVVVMIKYCLVVLFLGPNNGEGGQVAIYAKLARTLHVGPRGVTLPGELEPDDVLLLSKSTTHDSFASNFGHQIHGWFHEKILPSLLLFLCFFGCSLVLSDGLLTPTTSVLSAVGGVAVAAPKLENAVLPISCAILVVLFVAQQIGSSKLSSVFAPIVLLWFISIAVVGIINIAHYPAVFHALNPKLAVDFLRDNGGVDALGGVMLAMTGVEAMFADIGHFGRLSVQLALSCIVYPSLMLAYLGQGAFIIRKPDTIANAFYLSIPGGVGTPLYWYILVLATLATIIASQALILGVFSIMRQMIHIDCFPAFRVKHMSDRVFGQVYIPAVNYILGVGVILTTVGFQNSNNVTAAYGLGVSMDFFVTTTLITLCLVYVFRVPWYVYVPFILAFGALDMCFVVAGVRKVPHGAWFPLVMTFLFTSFISFWRWARALKVNQEYSSRVRLDAIFDGLNAKVERNMETLLLGAKATASESTRDSDGVLRISSLQTDVARMRGTVAIVHTAATQTLHSPNTVPNIISRLLCVFPGLPEYVLLVGTKVADSPFVSTEGRINMHAMRKIPGFYRGVVRYGFMDIEDIPVAELLDRVGTTGVRHVFHIVEDEHIYAKNSGNILKYLRTFAIEQVFAPLHRIFGQKQYVDCLKTEEGAEYSQEILYAGTVVRL